MTSLWNYRFENTFAIIHNSIQVTIGTSERYPQDKKQNRYRDKKSTLVKWTLGGSIPAAIANQVYRRDRDAGNTAYRRFTGPGTRWLVPRPAIFLLEPLVKFYDASLSPPAVAGAGFGTVCISHSWNSRSWKTNAPDGTFLRPASSPSARAFRPDVVSYTTHSFVLYEWTVPSPLCTSLRLVTRHAYKCTRVAIASRDTFIRTDLPVANSACILFLTASGGWIVLDEIPNTR